MRSICSVSSVAVVLLLFVMSCPCVVAAGGAVEFERIDPSYYQTDANSLIDIDGAGSVLAKRDALIRYIWAGEGFPSGKLPGNVEKAITDDRYADLYEANLSRIDKLTVEMDYGLHSIVYHFLPKQANSKLFIYHQGHRGDFVQGKDTIKPLLDKGYSVMALSMPLLGMNNQPVVDLERFGRFHLVKHDHMKLLKSPIRFFVEPVVVAINYGKKLEYDQVNMTGISGGGWTTTVCAAVDTRIQHSYPVAGTLPFYLRSDSQRDWGDFEQNMPDLYNIANYLELYVLGAFGEGRVQIQLLNQYDSCCFAGIKYRTYEQTMKDVMGDLGKGRFDIFLDDSHKDHMISTESLKVILKNEGL
ncbi:MAG: hypothetical protein AMJ65_12035 [Phycisphaerae bacterium SG8_4]|nr:MAG: hypothetical protein AMJ65_12035 [Phycisphaerae bacterium SG8_4]